MVARPPHDARTGRQNGPGTGLRGGVREHDPITQVVAQARGLGRDVRRSSSRPVAARPPSTAPVQRRRAAPRRRAAASASQRRRSRRWPTRRPATPRAARPRRRTPPIGLHRQFKKISATDARTVVFELCSPTSRSCRRSRSPSFAINDAGWLESHIDPAGTTNQAIVDRGQRHRPVQARGLEPRLGRHVDAQRRLLGRQGPDRAAHRALEQRGGPAARRAPGRHRRRHRQPRPDRLRDRRGRPEPAAQAARRA